MIFGEEVAVGFNEVINHFLDGVNIKLTACMGVEHGGLIDMLFFERCGGFDCEKLNIYVCHIHCGALHGKSTHMAGMNTVAVNEARHFYAGILGEIGDEVACVEHVTADFVGVACND